MAGEPILIVGEVCVDFTLATLNNSVKMRLGGIVHAARGLWASGIAYAVAVVCPEYLVDEAQRYLAQHGCREFILLGNIVGSPNVFVIGDVREVGHQGYEDILRDAKKVQLSDAKSKLRVYTNVVAFPGSFELDAVLSNFDDGVTITVDIAYDVDTLDSLGSLSGRLTNIAISTSSNLFLSIASDDVSILIDASKNVGAKHLLLKENRGGSRLIDLASGMVTYLPATLGRTVNSVGVGDAYTAVFAALSIQSPSLAAWRGMQVATRYAQTTFPDDLRRDIQRDLRLTEDALSALGGTSLPWHDRPRFDIYLAAPDFTYIESPEIDEALSSLKYHNFSVRRPVQENGEAPLGSPPEKLRSFYRSDVELLRTCSAVFAVPLQRDPGTLVEVGMAIEMGIPVITYDPRKENENTMVICGSSSYSADLDECLNGLFSCLSTIKAKMS